MEIKNETMDKIFNYLRSWPRSRILEFLRWQPWCEVEILMHEINSQTEQDIQAAKMPPLEQEKTKLEMPNEKAKAMENITWSIDSF